RAKDKSFNAKFETHFEENKGKLDIVPQDIGRVILNLINNAFYAVNEKLNAKRLTQNAESYEPTVIVSTKKVSPAGRGKGVEKIEISVQDNGNGIPDAVKEKIFQPFFTTKPTGEGTGLGLSLSYDIIKAHAGEFTVETKEGEGTTFTISIPVNQ
ncbi:MAG TPA: ATP-binding protein, partial [Chitinophagaceae bacterium]|nr:ATP-binding protein [Chitinophagaceae bacterium]